LLRNQALTLRLLPGLCRQVEFPPAKLTEPIDQFSGILASKIPGLIRQLREAALQLSLASDPGHAGNRTNLVRFSGFLLLLTRFDVFVQGSGMVWAFLCRRHKPFRMLRRADSPGMCPKSRDFLATGGCALKRTVPELGQAA